jgi:hypothetical protein
MKKIILGMLLALMIGCGDSDYAEDIGPPRNVWFKGYLTEKVYDENLESIEITISLSMKEYAGRYYFYSMKYNTAGKDFLPNKCFDKLKEIYEKKQVGEVVELCW